jgi:hypothetical protein
MEFGTGPCILTIGNRVEPCFTEGRKKITLQHILRPGYSLVSVRDLARQRGVCDWTRLARNARQVRTNALASLMNAGHLRLHMVILA